MRKMSKIKTRKRMPLHLIRVKKRLVPLIPQPISKVTPLLRLLKKRKSLTQPLMMRGKVHLNQLLLKR